MSTDTSVRRVRTSDGLELVVETYAGPPGAATIVCVHGYPDNRTVWRPVAERLREHSTVVTYDVRGAGESEAPVERSGYLIDQLDRDLLAVIDAVSPDEPVHLLAHDWGSIQAWAAVLGNIEASRLASYTSISGPDLGLAGLWLKGLTRHGWTGARKRLTQLAESYYIWFFQAPWLPEAAWRSGLLDRLLTSTAAVGRPPGVTPEEVAAEATGVRRTERDRINGLELYRANVLSRLRRPAPRPTHVPVQVIAPTKDIYVSVPLATEAPVGYATDLRIEQVDGGHWIVLDQPDLVAGLVRGFVADHTGPGREA